MKDAKVVTMYETSDGEKFDTRAEANKHEKSIDIRSRLDAFALLYFSYDMSRDMIVDVIMEEINELRGILGGGDIDE